MTRSWRQARGGMRHPPHLRPTRRIGRAGGPYPRPLQRPDRRRSGRPRRSIVERIGLMMAGVDDPSASAGPHERSSPRLRTALGPVRSPSLLALGHRVTASSSIVGESPLRVLRDPAGAAPLATRRKIAGTLLQTTPILICGVAACVGLQGRTLQCRHRGAALHGRLRGGLGRLHLCVAARSSMSWPAWRLAVVAGAAWAAHSGVLPRSLQDQRSGLDHPVQLYRRAAYLLCHHLPVQAAGRMVRDAADLARPPICRHCSLISRA